ncbi:MAG TPA: restriction endonuclease subunit S [Bacteroidales bacterium]|nr:restriction endonuclease subunit S [Bacteroidales bacterium]
MGEWKDITLGAVLKYEQPYKYTVESTQYNNSGVPVLTAGKSFILGYTSETNNLYSNLPVIIFDDFTSDCKFVDFPFKVKSSAMKFLKERNEEEISLKYFYEILQTLKLDSVGGDHKRRWISEYSKIKIKAPDFIEQTHIAEILSTADEAIAHTEALIAKYQRIKTGLMQDLLTKGIDDKGNIRSKSTHKFVVKNGIEVPKEWEVENLGALCKKGCGSIQTGPFGSQLHAEDYKEEGVPIITVEHLVDNRIAHENLPLVGEADYKRLKKYILNTGDLVFSRVGAIDRCSITTESEDGWMFSGRCLRVRPGKLFNSHFLMYQLNFDLVRNYILSNAVGSTMKCLNTTILSETPVFLPKTTEQIQISEKIESFENQLKQLNNRKAKLQSLKKGLMRDLLSGKVRVKI